MKLRFKILILFILSISIGFGSLILLINQRINQVNNNLTHHLNTQLIESKAIESGSWLNQRISELRVIAQLDAIRQMNDQITHPFINRLNDQFSQSYGNLDGTFAIGGLDGIGWVDDQISIDISQRHYFKQSLTSNDEYIISEPIYSHVDGKPTVLIHYPIRDNQYNHIGFINGAIALSKLDEIASNINFYNGHAWIMDVHGNLYTDTILPQIDGDDLLDLKLQFSKKNNQTVTTYNLPNKPNKIIFYHQIPYTQDWYLCIAVDKYMITKDTSQLINSILLIWIFSLILSILIAYILSKSITKPIESISKAMKSVRKGNFNTRIKTSGQDELNILADDFNTMSSNIEKLMHQVYVEQNEKRIAEIQVLQSQINPHFLYNTLDTLQWKAYEYHAIEIADLVNALSNFFRISLSHGRTFITIKQEIEHISQYLSIQQYRYQDILSYDIQCDSDLSEMMIVKMLIQPLVENAIYHGIKPSLKPGRISVDVKKEDNQIIIQVKDNGIGIESDKLEAIKQGLEHNEAGEGYGLHNINQRIHLLYGEGYSFEILSIVNEGTTISIKLPIIEEGDIKDDNINM